MAEFETRKIENQDVASTTSNITWKQVERALEEQNHEQISEYLGTLKEAIEQEDYISYLWCLKEILKAMYYFEQKNREMTDDVTLSLANSYMKYDMSDPLSVTAFIEAKLSEIERNNNCEYSKPIMNAMAYIKKHYYDENMSMTEVAKKCGVNQFVVIYKI